MAITATYDLTQLEHKLAPLPHHVRGLQFTRSGYGLRIPTANMVKLPGSPRWRRVYCCCYSNVGTCYVADKAGNWTVIR
jgi:hypothetical protein